MSFDCTDNILCVGYDPDFIKYIKRVGGDADIYIVSDSNNTIEKCFEKVYVTKDIISDIPKIQLNYFTVLYVNSERYLFPYLKFLHSNAIVIINNISETLHAKLKECSVLTAKALPATALPAGSANWTYFAFERPRVGIVSFAIGDEYQKIVEKGTISKLLYSNKYEYPILFDPGSIDFARPLSWSKIRQIQHFLPNFDYLLWIDADTIITNTSIHLDEILMLLPRSKDIMLGVDLNNINAGVFLIKNSEIAKEFLNETYAQEDLIHNGWWEQSAMIRLFESKYSSIVHKIPRKFIRIFNAYTSNIDNVYPHEPNDFVIHFAGVKGTELIQSFDRYKCEDQSPEKTHTLIYNCLKET